MRPESPDRTAAHSPVEILQRLIRFDTTNPPGNERECIAYVADLLADADGEKVLLARDPNRPNLVVRFAGGGTAPPLLLYGHVDVVTTANQPWPHPPFEGKIVDGFVWGRGALDMKGGIAMMLAALLRLRREGIPLPGDVILAVLSDEEADGTYGAKYVVEHHAGLFTGVRHAIGEFGGFTFHLRGRRFYPIMVGEKQICVLRLTVRGPGGHGAIPVHGGAMARLGTVLKALDRFRAPAHIHPTVARFITSLSRELPFPAGMLMRQLLKPSLTDRVLGLLGENRRLFDPMLHDTLSPTIVRGGEKHNVIPGEVELVLDGRLLPGRKPEDLVSSLRRIVGEEVAIEVERYDPGPPDCDLSLFDTLAAVLSECDPAGIPVPFLLTASTDARFFHRLGIQTYGFLPMKLPAEFNFTQTIHSASERIPLAALEFGTEALFRLLQRPRG